MGTPFNSALSRRHFLGGSAMLAGGLATGSLQAQEAKEVVIANWGGDWNTRTVKFIEEPLLESKGVKILRDLDGEPERRTKLLAEMRLPRGRLDVAHVGDYMAADLQSLGVWQEIDYSKVPNGKFIQENLKSPFFLPWQYSAWILLYDPKKMDKPTSFADLFNPKYAGRVGINDQHYFHNMEAAGLVASGNMFDFEAIKKQCAEWKKAVQPKIYPTHQQLQAAFKNGEIDIAANYKARGLQFAADGLSVATSYPKEGGITVIFGACIPKRAQHKDAAHDYLNALIDAKGIGDLVQASFYTPSVTNAITPADFKEKSGFSEDEQKKLLFQDFAYLAKNSTTTWLEWWNKEFKS
jgi:putative spermidine/putrescine transport system substrate-binding protein